MYMRDCRSRKRLSDTKDYWILIREGIRHNTIGALQLFSTPNVVSIVVELDLVAVGCG